jgi:hypothetical protein
MFSERKKLQKVEASSVYTFQLDTVYSTEQISIKFGISNLN